MASKPTKKRSSSRTEHKVNDRRRGAPTIADVAAYAGFAPMTVSRVINGETNVRQETRAGSEQVRIGMLYSNPSAAFMSELLVGCLVQTGISHVQLVIEKCDADHNDEDVIRELLATGVDGIMLPPPSP